MPLDYFNFSVLIYILFLRSDSLTIMTHYLIKKKSNSFVHRRDISDPEFYKE